MLIGEVILYDFYGDLLDNALGHAQLIRHLWHRHNVLDEPLRLLLRFCRE
jgi:hypothetical protein